MSINIRSTIAVEVTLEPSPVARSIAAASAAITGTSNDENIVSADIASLSLSDFSAQINSDVIARPALASLIVSDTGNNAITYTPANQDADIDATSDSLALSSPNPSIDAAGEPSPAIEVDWQSRISGPGVVWYHDFRSDAEVDAFRWRNGYGNDPNELSSAGRCVRNTSEGITGGGCLELYHPVGLAGNVGWWRPFSALSGSGNGRGVDDPAAGDTVPLYSDWDASQRGMNEDWRRSYYANPTVQAAQSGFDFDGTEFYLQYRHKVTASRFDSDTPPAGKIAFIATTQQTLNQELVVQNERNRRWLWYTNFGSSPDTGGSLGANGTNGKQIGGDYDSCDAFNPPYSNCWLYTADEWVTFLIHVAPGTDNNKDTFLRVFVARQGETSYEKLFEYTSTINFSPTSTGHAQGYNAFQPSNYMNNVSSGTAWSQFYDQVIFSRQPIPCPLQSTPVLHAAAESISTGESVNLLGLSTPVPLCGISRDEFAWQSRFHYDPLNNKCAVFGKAPGPSTGYQMRRYDVATNTWDTVWDDAHPNSGHIYGHNVMDPSTGDSYFNLYQTSTAWRLTQTGEINLPSHSYSFLGVHADGAGWHPNLYGPGDGAFVYFMVTRIIAWRKSTNTWDEIHTHGVNANQSSYGMATWLASDDALYHVGATSNTAWKIAPNSTLGGDPVVTTITNCPVNVQADSDANSDAFLEHPSDPTKLLALIGNGDVYEFDGSSWTLAAYEHPFTSAGGQGYSMCTIPALGVIWRLDNEASVLWRP